MGFNLNIQNYDANGTYINTTVLARKNGVGYFEASPQITIVPPYKIITVKWDQGADANLLPTDIVNQVPLESDVYGSGVKHWKMSSSNFIIWLSVKNKFPYNITSPSGLLLPRVGPFLTSILSNNNMVAGVIENYFISLEKPVYVFASYLNPFLIDLEISANVVMTKFYKEGDLEALKQRLLYELKLNNEVLFSNKIGIDTSSSYDFEFSSSGENIITAKLKIKNITINKEGYIDLKLHPAIYDALKYNNVQMVAYSDIKITSSYKYQSDYELNRAIDYTKNLSITVPLAATPFDIAKQKFRIDNSVSFSGATLNIPASQTKINVLNTYVTTENYNSDWVTFNLTTCYVLFSELFYNYILQYPNNLFIKKLGSTTFQKLDYYRTYHNRETGTYGIFQMYVFFEAGDELWVNIEASTTTITDKHYLENTWKRSGQTESDTYINTLLKMYHSAVATPIKKIEGTALGLFSPLDLIEFRYLTKANYQFINLELNLTTGTSNVTIIEAVNQNVTDYE